MINAVQLRAARALLNWIQKDLVSASNVSLPTVQRMETLGPLRCSAGNVDKVVKALEQAGIEFIDENGGGVGVRFRERGQGQ